MSSWLKFFVVCWLVSGCGYTLQHRLRPAFTDSRGIFIPVFDNKTDEVGAERILTNALIRELRSRGEVILTSRGDGGLELKGEVTGITVEPTAYSPQGLGGLAAFRRLPSELGVRISISLTLSDPKTGKAIWSHGFSGYRRVEAPLDRTRNYQAASAVGPLTQSIVESRFDAIARDIMYDVYDEMVALF